MANREWLFKLSVIAVGIVNSALIVWLALSH
jgi:hypothetical protein